MEMDRLSALPDCLLLRILYNLGLKEAAKTGSLSKQWRFLWTNLPFEMRCDTQNMEEIRSFVDSVDAALTLTLGRGDDHPSFNTFAVSFYYHKCFAPNVDSWLAKSKVQQLHLFLESNYINPPHKYTLPQIIYSNSSLTKLALKNCIFPSPETAVEWRYLKRLFLVLCMDLPVGEIMSNCPLLEELDLLSCSGFNRIEIGGRRFRRMCLSNYDEGLLEISAPYMKELRLIVYFSKSGTTVRLGNAQSLEMLNLDFRALKWDSISLETLRDAMLMFLHLPHLKTLHLSSVCTKVISIMSTNGWRIANPRLKILGMIAKSDVHSICGIVAMLESSPNLESLIITSIRGPKEEDKESISWGPITRDDLHCDLLHLKTVTFNVFSYSSDSGEPTH